MGFNGFYVESEIDKDVFVQPLIPDNLKNKIIKDLRMISIKSAMIDAKDIVVYILDAFKENKVSLDYIENRTKDAAVFQHAIAVAEISVIIGKALKLE